MLRLASLLMVICTAAPAFQQEVNPSDSEREKDVYAIYSLMLTNPLTSHGADDNKRYLIAATTAPGVPHEPCVRPPKEREADRGADFREALVDYTLRQGTQRQLSRSLTIAKPYTLLSADQVKEFQEARAYKNPPARPDERFRDVTDLFTLTDVYFNQRRTLALTAISTWCGVLCARWQWKVFERPAGGAWKDTQWDACLVIAEGLGPHGL